MKQICTVIALGFASIVTGCAQKDSFSESWDYMADQASQDSVIRECTRYTGENKGEGNRSDCNWNADCEHDMTRDIYLCRVTKQGNQKGPYIALSGSSIALISTNYSHSPGSFNVIRIDENEPETSKGRFSSRQTDLLLEQMSNGELLRFSGTKWPSTPVNATWSLDGFPQALSYARQWLADNADKSGGE